MKGVILAAGSGSRLAHYHNGSPKVLLRVGERRIIDYTLDSFARTGIAEVGIVIGYQGAQIRDWVGDGSRYGLTIEYLFNPDYELGNALSVRVAREFGQGEPILLSMADHMVSPVLLNRLVNASGEGSALAVDFRYSSRDSEEGTKVLVGEQGTVVSIGKQIQPWNGIDAGAFRFSPDIFEAIDRELLEHRTAQYELSRAVTRLIDEGGCLQACDVSGVFWHDVDTWEDLLYVRKVVSNDHA